MNFKTTLFLLVLLAIVGAFFLWDKDNPAEDPDAPQVDQTKQPLLKADAFDKDKIASVTIEKDGKTVTIKKTGTEWMQTAPVSFKLNSWSAGKPGESALSLTYTEKLTAGKNGTPTLADVKLDKPLAIVTVKFNDDTKVQTFKLGRRGIGGRAYLMLNDDASLYVVNDELHKTILDDDVTDWRSKSLKAPTEGQINQLTKVDDKGTLQVVKADGKWAFAGEHTGRVSRDAVSELLGAINGIYISKFVADKPADLSAYGLDKPLVKVTMQLPSAPAEKKEDAKESDNKESESKEDTSTTPRYQTFVVGGPVDLKKERYFATLADGTDVGDVVFEISKSDFEKFGKDADSLRDANLTPLVSTDMTRILISHNDQPVVQLLKSASGWGYGDPKPGFGLDQDLAKELMGKITDAKADSYIVNPKVDDKPLVTVTLGATGRASDDVLKVFANGADKVTVVRNNETVGYVVAKSQLDTVLGTSVAMLRNRVIKDWKPTDLKMVDITLPDGVNTLLHFTRTDSAWKLDGYDKHESFAFGSLLDALAPLKIENWQTPGPVGDKVYTITYGNDDSTLTLKVDADTRIAMLEEPQLSFMLSSDFVDKLKAELRPRTIVDVTRDAIQKVQVITKDQNVTVMQNDGKFTAEGVELDESKVGTLFDTLAGLRVERFTSPGKISRPIDVIVTTKDGEIRIQLSDNYSGQIGSTFFDLSESDFKNLTDKLSK